MMNWNTNTNANTNRLRRGFTLLELLIVIGILTILAVLTVISVGGISRDIKLSTGVNRVIASLGAARAEAIRTNSPVLLSFRTVKDNRRPAEPDQVQMVIARFTGEVIPVTDLDVRDPDGGSASSPTSGYADLEIYEPIAEYPPQFLPAGIKVAGPYSDFDLLEVVGLDPDFTWACMSSGPWTPVTDDIGAIDHYTTPDLGNSIGVLFAPDGSMVSRDPNSVGISSRATYKWVDHVGDRICPTPPSFGTSFNSRFFLQQRSDSEPFLNMCHFLVVYDEDRAKEELDFNAWTGESDWGDYYTARQNSLGTWINEHADRIHFNKYTGIAKVGGQ